MSELVKKLKQYNRITQYAAVARRYFVNNFYDGNLTVAGVLLGFFTLLLRDPGSSIDSSYVILTGFGTAISMLISGISGSYLSERAELRKEKIELEKAMGVYDRITEEFMEEDPSSEEIRKAMLLPVKKERQMMKTDKYNDENRHKKHKTLHEKAERFTGIFVSLINGISPFLGGIVPLIPFFFVLNAGFPVFITAFFIIFICIVFLGIFLGKISKDSILKNTVQMTGFFILTIVITIVFLGG